MSKETDLAKYVKIFNRGILTWDETHDAMIGVGFTSDEVVAAIGTKDEYIEAMKEAGHDANLIG